jgi:hypothetical protein
MYWIESLGRIELNITKAQAESCSHPGPCDNDVTHLRTVPAIRRQLDKLSPALVAECLSEYGAWDDDELSDHEQNLDRLLWVACCELAEQ